MVRRFSLAAFFLISAALASSAPLRTQSAPMPAATPAECGNTQSPASAQEIATAAGVYRAVLDRGVGSYAPPPDYQAQRALYEAKIACNKRGGAPDSTSAGIYEELGITEEHLGLYDEAIESELTAKALFSQSKPPNIEAQANDDNDLGNAESGLGEYDEAMQSYGEALSGYTQLQNQGAVAVVLIDRAACEERQGHYAIAMADAELAKKTLGHFSERILATTALIESDLQHYSDAWNDFRSAIAYEEQSRNGVEESEALDGAAAVALHVNNYASAIKIAGLALGIDKALGTPTWQSLATEAAAEAALKQTQSAINDYDAALSDIESLRTNATEASRASFFATTLYVYDAYTAYLARLGGPVHERKAFEIFERRQGRAFLEQVGQSAANRFSGVPPDVSDKSRELRDRISGLQTTLAQVRTVGYTDAVVNVKSQLDVARSEQGQLETQIKTQYPAYYQLLYPQPIELADLQNCILRPGELMLVYDVLENASVLFVVSRERFQLVSLPSRRALSGSVDGFRQAIVGSDARGDISTFASEGSLLYRQLIPTSVRATVARAQSLIVVPSDALYGMPWEALVTQTPTNGKLHYLIEDRAISYVPSASTLGVVRGSSISGPSCVARNSKNSEAPKTLLAFARPAYTSAPAGTSTPGVMSYAELQYDALRAFLGGGFADLRGSETEVDAVRGALGAQDASIFTGEHATRTQVLDLNRTGELKAFRYVLFATHAVLPDQIKGVTQPALVLAHPELGDGFLTMKDVFALTLNADFVELAACNTGTGPATAGEGISGFTRAFIYAGTPAISVTLWRVEDLAAPLLSAGLFGGMRQGLGPAVALRQAQLEMIKSDDPRLRQPFAWAPYVMFGDGAGRSNN